MSANLIVNSFFSLVIQKYFLYYVSMKAASIDDLKKELKELPSKKVLELTLRLARFKKENKELLTYLLFESHNEQEYISSLKKDMDEQFADVQTVPVSNAKKQYRRILRGVNRQIKYIGNKNAAVELLLYFSLKLRQQEKSLHPKLKTILMQQLGKSEKLLPMVEEDLQYDFRRQIESLREGESSPATGKRKWWKRSR